MFSINLKHQNLGDISPRLVQAGQLMVLAHGTCGRRQTWCGPVSDFTFAVRACLHDLIKLMGYEDTFPE